MALRGVRGLGDLGRGRADPGRERDGGGGWLELAVVGGGWSPWTPWRHCTGWTRMRSGRRSRIGQACEQEGGEGAAAPGRRSHRYCMSFGSVATSAGGCRRRQTELSNPELARG